MPAISFFFFNDTATTEIYTLSLHDALPISKPLASPDAAHHRGGQSSRDQRWTLPDVQLEARPDAGRIEKPPPFPDRLRIADLLLHRRLETLTVVSTCERVTSGVSESESSRASPQCEAGS